MHHMQHTLKNKKVPIAVALGGFLASAIVFQGVFSKDAPDVKSTSLSSSEGSAGTEIGIQGSRFTSPQKGTSDKKEKDVVSEPEKHMPMKDEVVPPPIPLPDATTPATRVDVLTPKIFKESDEKVSKEKSEPSEKKIKVIDVNGKSGNDKKEKDAVSAPEKHMPSKDEVVPLSAPPPPRSTLKITSLSPFEGPAGTEIQILGSGFTTSLEGISGTKVKNDVLAPGNYLVIQDEVVPEPLLSPDGVTLTARVDLLTSKLVKKCEEKFSKKKPEPCRVQIKVINAYGKSSNRKGFLITGPAADILPSPEPTPTPNPRSEATISLAWPMSGRGWAPNTNMYIKVTVANYDQAHDGEITFDLVRAGSIVQTFGYTPKNSWESVVPQNGTVNAIWMVPSSLAAGNDYTLEASFANLPKTKVSSQPFSILGGSVTINGQTVDVFTGMPVQSTLSYNQNGVYMHPSSDAAGNFSVTEPTIQFWETTVAAYSACYINGFGFSSWVDYSAYGYEQPNNFIGDDAFGILIDQGMIVPRLLYVPILGPSVDIKIQKWPGVDFSMTSDIPVVFEIDYPNISGPGNGNYSTSHALNGGVVPLDLDVTVKLTDQAGITYVSPILHLPRDHGCAPVTLDFTGGKFTWEP